MIDASDEFKEQENNPHTANPVFFFTFLPHYFATGVAAASGTFVNVSFIAPGRLQVDDGAGYGWWFSPVLMALVGNLPTTIIPTFDLNSPGHIHRVGYLRPGCYHSLYSLHSLGREMG